MSLGDLAISKGEIRAACDLYDAALEISRPLAKESPLDLERKRSVATHLERLGSAKTKLQDSSGAIAALEEALQLRRELSAQQMQNLELKNEMAIAELGIGDVWWVIKKDGLKAKAYFKAALDTFEALARGAPAQPEWQRGVATVRERLGDIELSRKNYGAAFAELQRILEIRTQLATGHPEHLEWQSELALTHGRMGDLRAAQGKSALALAAYETAVQVAKGVAARSPDNVEAGDNLMILLAQLGSFRLSRGDLVGAEQAYVSSLEQAKKLASRSPANPEWWVNVAIAETKLAGVDETRGAWTSALTRLTAAREAFETVKSLDPRHITPTGPVEEVLMKLDDYMARLANRLRNPTDAKKSKWDKPQAMGSPIPVCTIISLLLVKVRVRLRPYIR